MRHSPRRITRRWALGVLSAITLASPLHAEDLLRVAPAGQPPADSRLGRHRDYNTVAAWNPAATTRADWEKEAQQIREQILTAAGLFPMPADRAPVTATIHGKIDRDEYTVEKVYFESFPGHYVTGNLYRPKKAPPQGTKMPAVLCPHGHWNNGRFFEANDAAVKKELASGAEKTPEGAKYPLQARCAMLARMGCVVFHYDMIGYADSKGIEHRRSGNVAPAGFEDVDPGLRLQSVLGLQTWNSVRALDFVAALPEVDASRLAVTGASGGGTQSMLLAAIDPRIAVSFPAVMVSQNMQGGCVCENAPLLRVNSNNIAFAAAYAPKPQAMTGADDWTKDIETNGLPQLKKVYGLFDAADHVAATYKAFGHNYNQVSRELMYNWLNTHLKLGLPSPVVEKPFTPVPPKDLSVWNDSEHKVPANVADAKAVLAAWTEASEKGLRHMIASDPNDYRRMLTGALRAMVGDRWPVQAQIVDGSIKQRTADGATIETGLVTRPADPSFALVSQPAAKKEEATKLIAGPEKSAVPYAFVKPADWNGETIIMVHPAGKGLLVDETGALIGPVKTILAAKYAVLAGDLYATGEFLEGGKTPADLRPVSKDFSGFTLGYNRSVLGERVHDILTLVALAKAKESKFVHQVAFGGAGHWGLLAKGLAGEAILRSAIDLNGFDFDQVKETSDENFLPGTLKYGGVMTFAS
ncbi:MAG: alpha/beta hydrolase family protein, partial [Phycisphaerae bacterium]